MSDAHYRLQVERDHIKKLASAKPIQAVAELIWNAVDADATRIDLEIDSDDVAMRAVTIRDDGHGIPHADVEAIFGKLGRFVEGPWQSVEDKGPHPPWQGGEGSLQSASLRAGRGLGPSDTETATSCSVTRSQFCAMISWTCASRSPRRRTQP